jgi:hypothetical protein
MRAFGFRAGCMVSDFDNAESRPRMPVVEVVVVLDL